MKHNLPPLFRQGTPAFIKMLLFALTAIILLIADSRLHSLGPIRATIHSVLYPVKRIALLPRDGVNLVSDYFSSLSTVQEETRNLQQQRLTNAQTLQQAKTLLAENEQLRALLGAHKAVPARSVLAEILYDARAPFTRKIIIDRGSEDGIVAGQPAIDDHGVLGQVTRVFPLSAEVTLLIDKDQTIPVQILRNGLRSVTYGLGESGLLSLRFVLANADIREGDILVTSGLGGVYPAGLAVAKITKIEKQKNQTFSKISCTPFGKMDNYRHLLVLLVKNHIPFPSDKAPEKKADKNRNKKGGES